jgi:hypothetical protein
MSLNEVCFLNIVNDVRDGGLVVLSTFTTSSSSFHYCLLDQGHILYNKKEYLNPQYSSDGKVSLIF